LINQELPYHVISPIEAKQAIDNNNNAIILDVRRYDEYLMGHIPDALLIPIEVLHEDALDLIPNKELPIYIYCHAGIRSKYAAELLVNMGYTNIYEFGGIISWPYEIEYDD